MALVNPHVPSIEEYRLETLEAKVLHLTNLFDKLNVLIGIENLVLGKELKESIHDLKQFLKRDNKLSVEKENKTAG